MRKVDRTLVAKPAALESADCTNHLMQINAFPATKVSSNHYKGKVDNPDGSSTNTVVVSLKEIYKNKCAYCEKLCYYPRVEHFRPKGRVIGLQPLRHGYYWLCYEWTNLLPACHECNSIEAKGDKFPINGVRKNTHPVVGNPPIFDPTQNVFNSNYLTDEDPCYIHPEYCDNFWDHFDFERDGRIVGLSNYGIRTIADFKLDDKDRNGWRRAIYELHYNRFLRLLRRFKRQQNPISDEMFDEELDDIISDMVYESIDDELPYTLFRKSLVKKLEYFFIEPLDPVFRQEMKDKFAQSLLNLE